MNGETNLSGEGGVDEPAEKSMKYFTSSGGKLEKFSSYRK